MRNYIKYGLTAHLLKSRTLNPQACLLSKSIIKRDFPEKWKVSFSYVLYKGKNPKVALKEIMQHISLLERKGE